MTILPSLDLKSMEKQETRYFRPQVETSLQQPLRVAALKAGMEMRTWISTQLEEILKEVVN